KIRNSHDPPQKYLNDIKNLFVFNGLLLAMTSTNDKNKGTLIDVFNHEGKYIDNFYLKLSGSLLASNKDSILVKEKDKDENILIVQYQIIE
ncbi:MAG: hypothetical protein U9Q97_00885, partial [Acidobacteriota bacterium]|nr:hypothetical protein [Acidobacteriota bacterium]